MGKRTKSGFYFPSTFDVPRPLIMATNINDPASVMHTVNVVTNYLGKRIKEEEGAGAGAFGPAYAADRIHGSIADYERMKAQLVHASAPAEFIGLIDTILIEARRAFDVACACVPEDASVGRLAPANGELPMTAQPWAGSVVPVNGSRMYTTLTAEDIEELVRGPGSTTGGQ